MRGSSVDLAKALGSGVPAEMGLEMGEEGHFTHNFGGFVGPEMGILVIQHGWKNGGFHGDSKIQT